MVEVLNQKEVDILPRLSIFEESDPFKGRGVGVFYPWEDLFILEYRNAKLRQVVRVGIPIDNPTWNRIEFVLRRLFAEAAENKRPKTNSDIIRQIWSFFQKVVAH
jgi:hypothetical protein